MIRLEAATEFSDQIMSTALSLAAITGQALQIEGPRSVGFDRRQLKAVHAFAAICSARVLDVEVGSSSLTFIPEEAPRAGSYDFDVGSASSILPSMTLALALAEGESRLVLRGATHDSTGPSFDYLRDVWRPMLFRIGLKPELVLASRGWDLGCPGEIQAQIEGLGRGRLERLRPLQIMNRGRLLRIAGLATAANLPVYVAQEIADYARAVLTGLTVETSIGHMSVCAGCAGIGMFLLAEYEHARVGWSGYGGGGKSLRAVAEGAVSAFMAHHEKRGALDVRLADQLLMPLSLTGERSTFTVDQGSAYLEAKARLIERFGLARISVEPLSEEESVLVTIDPEAFVHADSMPSSVRPA